MRLQLGKPSCKKKCFLSGIARITSPPSPQFEQLVPLFLDVKNDILARITETTNDNYDNGITMVLLLKSDNCYHNFGTFDDFCVKNDQRVSHNMTLKSKYKGQQGGERVKKFGQGSLERKHFFLQEGFP